MKKQIYLCALAMCLISPSLLAQDAPKEKKFFVGTGFNFSSSKGAGYYIGTGGGIARVETKDSRWHISPQIGMYIKERLAVGIEGSYGRINQGGSSSSAYPVWSAGAFVRYVVPLWQSRFSIYNDAVFRTRSEDASEVINEVLIDKKTQSYGIYYRPGIQFRLTDRFNLLGSLGEMIGYTYSAEKRTPVGQPQHSPAKTNRHNVGIQDNFNINSFNIGVNFLF